VVVLVPDTQGHLQRVEVGRVDDVFLAVDKYPFALAIDGKAGGVQNLLNGYHDLDRHVTPPAD